MPSTVRTTGRRRRLYHHPTSLPYLPIHRGDVHTGTRCCRSSPPPSFLLRCPAAPSPKCRPHTRSPKTSPHHASHPPSKRRRSLMQDFYERRRRRSASDVSPPKRPSRPMANFGTNTGNWPMPTRRIVDVVHPGSSKGVSREERGNDMEGCKRKRCMH